MQCKQCSSMNKHPGIPDQIWSKPYKVRIVYSLQSGRQDITITSVTPEWCALIPSFNCWYIPLVHYSSFVAILQLWHLVTQIVNAPQCVLASPLHFDTGKNQPCTRHSLPFWEGDRSTRFPAVPRKQPALTMCIMDQGHRRKKKEIGWKK